MCDWLINNLPWCVEHIGGMALPWQTALALVLVAAAVLVYYAAGIAIDSACARPAARVRARNRKVRRAAPRVTLRERLKELNCYSDYEVYDAEWIDYEKFINE